VVILAWVGVVSARSMVGVAGLLKVAGGQLTVLVGAGVGLHSAAGRQLVVAGLPLALVGAGVVQQRAAELLRFGFVPLAGCTAR
jgi:hypothetical protein